jgi:hypothetical protein
MAVILAPLPGQKPAAGREDPDAPDERVAQGVEAMKAMSLLRASLAVALACAPAMAQTEAPSWEDAVPGRDYVVGELLVGFEPELFSVPTDDASALTFEQATQLHAELKAAARALAAWRP